MKRLILITLLLVCNKVCAQSTIDLKALIGKPEEAAMQQLEAWKIKLSPSAANAGLWVGFNNGIQLETENDKVTTIWIEFTARRTGAFPFQVDDVIKPETDVHEVIRRLGKPHATGGGTEIGSTQLGGWVKWNTKAYQLHCEVVDSKVVMVTLMSPDWEPGK